MGEVFGGYEGNPARNDEGDTEGISERTTKNALRNGSLIKECVELPLKSASKNLELIQKCAQAFLHVWQGRFSKQQSSNRKFIPWNVLGTYHHRDHFL